MRSRRSIQNLIKPTYRSVALACFTVKCGNPAHWVRLGWCSLTAQRFETGWSIVQRLPSCGHSTSLVSLPRAGPVRPAAFTLAPSLRNTRRNISGADLARATPVRDVVSRPQKSPERAVLRAFVSRVIHVSTGTTPRRRCAWRLLTRRDRRRLGHCRNNHAPWTASSSTAGLPTTILAGRPG